MQKLDEVWTAWRNRQSAAVTGEIGANDAAERAPELRRGRGGEGRCAYVSEVG